MAAAAPRKRTTPRKSTAPRAERKPSPDREVVEAYAELRDRARRSGLELKRGGNEPFVVPGFDPPIEARWPSSLLDIEDFNAASRRMDVFGMLRMLLTPTDFRRVLTEFDQYDDGDDLLIGLVMKIIDHANGPGASEVPGGSTAS